MRYYCIDKGDSVTYNTDLAKVIITAEKLYSIKHDIITIMICDDMRISEWVAFEENKEPDNEFMYFDGIWHVCK